MKGSLIAAALLCAGLAVSCGNNTQKAVTPTPVAGNWSLQAVVYRSDTTNCLTPPCTNTNNCTPLCSLSVPPNPDPTNSSSPTTGKVAAPLYQATLVPSDSCSLTDSWTRSALPQCTTSSCTQTFSVTGKCFVAKADPTANQGSITCSDCENFWIDFQSEPNEFLQPVALLVGASTDPVSTKTTMEYVLEMTTPAKNGVVFFTKTKDATISAGLMQGDWTCGTADDTTVPSWANACNPVGFYGTFEAKTAQ